MTMGYKSNAALGKEASDASTKAVEATQQSRDDDAGSHERAASAHYSAAWRQRDAGNETQAQVHEKAAKLHSEKADTQRRADYYAQGEGRAAEELSKKADMAAFGQDDKELRNEKQLHADAAEAHKRASKAFKLAGKKKEAAYHDAKSQHHDTQAQTSPVDDMASMNEPADPVQ